MRLTKFGKRTLALIALAIVLIALAIGAVLVLTDTWHISMDAHKTYNVVYMAVCLPVGIAATIMLKDHI